MRDLSYSELLFLSTTIEPKLLFCSLLTFQEIKPAVFLLQFSNQESLLISLRHPFVRFHLVQKKPLSHSTPFCKKVERALVQQKVASFSLLNADRILSIGFANELSLVAELFSRGANLYLLSKEKEILVSLVPIEKAHYTPPPKPKEHLFEEVDLSFITSLESSYQKAEEEAFFTQEKEFLCRKIGSLENRLAKELSKQEQTPPPSERKLQEALLLQSNYHLLHKGQKEIELEDLSTKEKKRISLNPALFPQQQLSSFFHKAHRLKKEEVLLAQKKQKTKNILDQCKELLQKIEKASSLQELLSLRTTVFSFFPKKQKTPREFLEFSSASGQKILVGRNDRENDRLTFSIANGSDLWLHVADDPGSHVVVKTEKGKKIDEETLLDAAHLALFYSKAKERISSDIFIAERKFLTRVKGKPGQVHMSRHRKIFIRLDPNRIERIKKTAAAEK